MALATKLGSFKPPSSQGSQAISGVGFQPKAVILHSAHKNGTSADGWANWAIGFATAPTERASGWLSKTQDHISPDTATSSSVALGIGHSANGSAAIAEVVTFDSDGFTLSWMYDGTIDNDLGTGGTLDIATVDVFYIALGGDDLIDAYAGSYNPTGATVNVGHAVTAPAFEPNAALFAMHRTIGSDNGHSFGVATPDAQWSEASFFDGYSGALSYSSFRNDDAMHLLNTSSFAGIGKVTSFTPSGFNVTWSQLPPSDVTLVPYLALRLANPRAGIVTQSATTGSQSISGMGITPKAALFAHAGMGGINIANLDAHTVFGLSDGATTVSTNAYQNRDSFTGQFGRQTHGRTLEFVSDSGNGAVVSHGTASLDLDGFTFNWGQQNGVARPIGYLLFGDSAPTGTVQDGQALLDVVATAGGFDPVRLRNAVNSIITEATLATTPNAFYVGASALATNLGSSSTPSRVRVTLVDAASEIVQTAEPARIANAEFAAFESVLIEVNGGLILADGMILSTTLTPILTGQRVLMVLAKGMQTSLGQRVLESRRFRGSPFAGSTQLLLSPPIGDVLGLAVSATPSIRAFLAIEPSRTTLGAAILDATAFLAPTEHRIRGDLLNANTVAVLTSAADIVIDDAASVSNVLNLTSNPHRLRSRAATLTIHLTTQARPNATLNARTSSVIASYEAMRGSRLRPDAVSASAGTTMTGDPSRVRDSLLSVYGDSVLTPSGTVIAAGSLHVGRIIDISVIPSAMLAGSIDLDAATLLTTYATPLLLVTYHDAFGTVRQGIATAEVIPPPTSAAQQRTAQTRHARPTTRVRLPTPR